VPLQETPPEKSSGFMGLFRRESPNSGSHAHSKQEAQENKEEKEELFIEH